MPNLSYAIDFYLRTQNGGSIPNPVDSYALIRRLEHNDLPQITFSNLRKAHGDEDVLISVNVSQWEVSDAIKAINDFCLQKKLDLCVEWYVPKRRPLPEFRKP